MFIIFAIIKFGLFLSANFKASFRLVGNLRLILEFKSVSSGMLNLVIFSKFVFAFKRFVSAFIYTVLRHVLSLCRIRMSNSRNATVGTESTRFMCNIVSFTRPK